jgi:hypothetical protein
LTLEKQNQIVTRPGKVQKKCFRLLRHEFVTYEKSGERETKQRDAAEHKIGVAPAVMIDHPLRHREGSEWTRPAAGKKDHKQSRDAY